MKLKRLSLAIVAGCLLTLSSCGIHSTVSPTITETKVILEQNNFKVVGQAYGEAKCAYICGIGGLSKKSLQNNAIENLTRNAKLSGSQTLINVTTHTDFRMYTPFYIEYFVTATGNIVEFK